MSNIDDHLSLVFRMYKCIHFPFTLYPQAVKQLLRISKERSQPTEVRIFSYKASIECANASDISSLLDVISAESNSQGNISLIGIFTILHILF